MRSNTYGPPLDIFALGCIFAELYMQRPIFPGKNELDQLQVLCSILGTPSESEWPEGHQSAFRKKIKFPEFPKVSLATVMPNASESAIELMEKMLEWNPIRRPSAKDILEH